MYCPDCQCLNPKDANYCFACGHRLTLSSKSNLQVLSYDDKLAKIQRYLPKDLTEKILAHRDKIEGERQKVTVMFCDMKGFTPLTEALGPEETFSLMDQFFEVLIHTVRQHEGTVNELRGDGILALFGAPIALEDGTHSLKNHVQPLTQHDHSQCHKRLNPQKSYLRGNRFVRNPARCCNEKTLQPCARSTWEFLRLSEFQ
jgi:class 3 adenylate cyclase